MAAADYARNVSGVIPPPELLDYFKGQMFQALPNGNGWKHEPYRWINRVSIYISVYNAALAYKRASGDLKGKKLIEWTKANKDIVEAVNKVEKLRNGIDNSNNS